MYKYLFSVLISVSLLACQENKGNFEGVVKYHQTYDVYFDFIDDSLLQTQMGDTSINYIQGGNYLEKSNSEFMNTQLYRSEDQRVYFMHKNAKDTLFWFNTLQKDDSIVEMRITRNKEKVLGHMCDELYIRTNEDTKKYYYFSSDFPRDSLALKDFHYSGISEASQQMGAIYLKLTLQYPSFKVTYTAFEVNREKLDSALFNIPPHQVLVGL